MRANFGVNYHMRFQFEGKFEPFTALGTAIWFCIAVTDLMFSNCKNQEKTQINENINFIKKHVHCLPPECIKKLKKVKIIVKYI